MLAHLFLGLSLVGAEWVLYLLIGLSVLSVAIIFERLRFYRGATQGLIEFRQSVRHAAAGKNWPEAVKIASQRTQKGPATDLESEMALALLSHPKARTDVLAELASDSVLRTRILWERNLSALATIGVNAPFVGLFGTVLGIIKAFHDLSQQAGGAQAVTGGISESLVATAVGILVAIPAAVAFNLFQRKVKSAVAEAESLKSFLIGNLAE